MKPTDFNTPVTSENLNEAMFKKFGTRIDFNKYTREELENYRNLLRTEVSQTESISGFNELLSHERHQRNKAMLDVLNTRIKEMLGESRLSEKAPPGKKAERMVKAIKKSYSKNGLTDQERAIAYAKTWAAKKKGVVEERFYKKGTDAYEEAYVTNEIPDRIQQIRDSSLEDFSESASRENKMNENIRKVNGKKYSQSRSNQMNKTKTVSETRKITGWRERQRQKEEEEEQNDKNKNKNKNKSAPKKTAPPDPVKKRRGRPRKEDPEKEVDHGPSIELGKILGSRVPDNPRKGDLVKGYYQSRFIDPDDYDKEETDESMKKKLRKSVKENYSVIISNLRRLINEDEEGKAKDITAGSDMVNDFTGWMQRIGQYQTKTMIELADSIRANFGQQQSNQFKETIAPALDEALSVLMKSRETLTRAVAVLAGEELPQQTPMGGSGEGASAEEEKFTASDAAAGGAETAGRELRESRKQRIARVMAEQHSIIGKLSL